MADIYADYLLIGGGRTSANAAEAIRESDQQGSILIVAQEDRKPYDRPPLSKNFLEGKPPQPEDVESKPDDFFEKHKVDLLRGISATSIDRDLKEVKLSDGKTAAYGKLLLATGATPRTLSLPGADLGNVYYLRTVDDSAQIRDAGKAAKSVVLIGSGFIGMEVAATLTGLGAQCTVIGREDQPWGHIVSGQTGSFLRRYFEGKGVRFVLPADLDSFTGSETVEGVKLKSGETLPCDMVAVGIGVELNTKLAQEAGLTVDPRHGVYTSAALKTEDPQIWAAGDIAYFEDVTAGRRKHYEHYMNADWQGTHVGKNMAGSDAPYDKVSYFFSDMFDLHFVLRGDPEGGKPAKVLGNVDEAEFIELYADEAGVVKMGLAFTRDYDKQDAIGDKIEAAILQKKAASEIDESYF